MFTLFYSPARLVQCSSLLVHIEKCSVAMNSIIGETYYYAICFDLILDTG